MAQNESPYLYKTHEKQGQTLNYRILYPVDFDESKSYPLVVFLHGAGERGTDNEQQLVHGSKLFADSIEQYPAIVIFPQCVPEDFWANITREEEGGYNKMLIFNTEEAPKPSLALVIDLMENFMAKDFVDKERIYIAGLSMGGFGVWELLWRMPEKIAAAIPICGGGATQKAEAMTGIPIWAIHGVKDDVVLPQYSVMMTFAVQAAGGHVRLSLYPDANHNSWDAAFAEPTFLQWLFSKRKNTK